MHAVHSARTADAMSSYNTVLRGEAAKAGQRELMALRSENEALNKKLESAEKTAKLAARQAAAERDRRSALTATLRGKEEALNRMSANRELGSSATSPSITTRQYRQDAIDRLAASPTVDSGTARTATTVLRKELRLVEAEATRTIDSLHTPWLDSLARCAEVERPLPRLL